MFLSYIICPVSDGLFLKVYGFYIIHIPILLDVFLELLTPLMFFQWPDVYFKQLLNTISDFMDPDLLQALQFCIQSTCIVFLLHWRRVGNIPQPVWDWFPQMLING